LKNIEKYSENMILFEKFYDIKGEGYKKE